MRTTELVQVGKVHKAHGIRGWLKVEFSYPLLFSEDAPPNAFFIGKGKRTLPYLIEEVNLNAEGHVLIKFEEVDGRNEANAIQNKDLFMQADLVEEFFDLNEYSLDALVGFQLFDQDEQAIGQISDVIEMPHQDLLEVQYQEREILIPLIEEHILHIDQKKKTIQVQIADGLLDL